MQEQIYTSEQNYPIKIVSRSALRSKRLRMVWMAAGTAFSLGCASALTPIFSPSNWLSSSSFQESAKADIDQEYGDVNDALQANILAAGDGKALEAIVASNPFGNEDTAEVAAPVLAAAEEKSSIYPQTVHLRIKNGDTLGSLLADNGISADEARAITESMHRVYNTKKLDIGHTLALQLDKPVDGAAPIVTAMSMPVSLTASAELTRGKDNAFNVKKVEAPIERRLARAGGPIAGSIYQTGVNTGLPPALLNEIITAYSYDVDFQREVKQGDAMDVLYEKLQTKDGAAVGHGNIVYAELDLGDRELKIYRYTDKSGNADYYTSAGESIRKALLRTPINGAKITSGFGMRNHPLLGYTKMHRGVDFGAPLGTPIYASGDGKVEFIGKKNGYGNFLKIKHNNTYASAYAHISRFASGITPGGHVRQGQIIAYVGQTGWATGPHLHYEILVNNEQVNPANVKFKTGNVLAGKELIAFKDNMKQIENKLASLPQTGGKLAMAETGGKNAAN